MKSGFLFCCFTFLSASLLFGQTDVPCELLHLTFDGNSKGNSGEIPTSMGSVTYEAGVKGQCASIAVGSNISFDKVNNIDEQKGTLEFWINPRGLWVPLDHEYFLSFGIFGGLVAMKDGTNSARMIFSQYSTPQPELDVAFSLGSWDINEWHYLVYTWDMDTLNLYMDGVLVNSDKYCINMPPLTCYTFPPIASSTIAIGSCRGSFDEFIIHGCAKSATYVAETYYNTLHPPPEPLEPEEPVDSVNEIIVYELISPNNDGRNDLFYIQNIEKYPDHELTIINSWGNQIFHSKKYDNSWDGATSSDGTYYYQLNVTVSSRQLKTYKGRLIIRR